MQRVQLPKLFQTAGRRRSSCHPCYSAPWSRR